LDGATQKPAVVPTAFHPDALQAVPRNLSRSRKTTVALSSCDPAKQNEIRMFRKFVKPFPLQSVPALLVQPCTDTGGTCAKGRQRVNVSSRLLRKTSRSHRENRMTQTFAAYLARLGEFIHHAVPPTGPADPVAMETEFDSLALALFGLQFEHNLPYRNLCVARGWTPANVRLWQQIPAAPTAAFKELDLTSLPVWERPTVFHSSGTTGHRPSRHFHNPTSLGIYESSLLPWFRHHLLPEAGEPQKAVEFQFISLTPPVTAAPHSSLAHMFEVVQRAFGSADSFFAGRVSETGVWTCMSSPRIAELQEAARPVMVLGTAFGFVEWLDSLAIVSRKLRLPPSSRVLETGGYKGRSRALPKEELHALISDRLGIGPENIVSEYGMSELSSQAYDAVAGRPRGRDPAPRRFQFPPWARSQLISPETGREIADGETGLIRVLDLANVYSVMTVQTEDLGVRHGGGFALLGRAAAAEPRGCSLTAP